LQSKTVIIGNNQYWPIMKLKNRPISADNPCTPTDVTWQSVHSIICAHSTLQLKKRKLVKMAMNFSTVLFIVLLVGYEERAMRTKGL